MKKLSEQTIVITGASSGIGLATAKMAAQRGARVVLSSRNEPELRRIVDEIRREGGEAIHVAADMADEGQVRSVAEAAVRTFGGIDTWVNNAGISIYGRALDVPLGDQRRLFDVNFWGNVHGARVALPHLRLTGGTLINVGSSVSERAIPLQSAYDASKHALKAWMDALRMELEEQDIPVAVVLVEPGSIDTPFPQHARNYMDEEPNLPPPLYAPEVVARAILAMAEKPKRHVRVGTGAPGLAAVDKFAPRLGDKVMERQFFRGQQTGEPRPRLDALYRPPAREGDLRGAGNHHALRHSATTWGSMHRGTSIALAAAAALGAFAATRSMRRSAGPASWRSEERPERVVH